MMSTTSASTADTPRARLRRRLYVVAAVVALLGLADGIYLTVEHVSGRTAECVASSGCQEVLGSKYAAVGPLPLAAIGAFAYFTVFSTTLLAAFGYPKCGGFFAFVITLMFATTLCLLYIMTFVLHAFCDYCLFSAAVTTTLTLIAIANAFLRGRKQAIG